MRIFSETQPTPSSASSVYIYAVIKLAGHHKIQINVLFIVLTLQQVHMEIQCQWCVQKLPGQSLTSITGGRGSDEILYEKRPL